MSKFAVILYPNFSLHEITCLTSALTVWFGEKIDFIASENKEYYSEKSVIVGIKSRRLLRHKALLV